MSEVTDIRSKQIISFGSGELLAVINAALSGAFTLHQDGEFTLEAWQSGLSPAGEVFRASFFGRKFANLESVAVCVIDTGIEQIMLHEDGAYAGPKNKAACHFCDSLSTRFLSPKTTPTSTHSKGFQVECFNCGARGPLGYIDKASAQLAWMCGDRPASDQTHIQAADIEVAP